MRGVCWVPDDRRVLRVVLRARVPVAARVREPLLRRDADGGQLARADGRAEVGAARRTQPGAGAEGRAGRDAPPATTSTGCATANATSWRCTTNSPSSCGAFAGHGRPSRSTMLERRTRACTCSTSRSTWTFASRSTKGSSSCTRTASVWAGCSGPLPCPNCWRCGCLPQPSAAQPPTQRCSDAFRCERIAACAASGSRASNACRIASCSFSAAFQVRMFS